MKKNKSLDSLLMNDKVAFITAVVAAIIIWLCVVLQKDTEIQLSYGEPHPALGSLVSMIA